MEKWLPVVDWEGYYEVSNTGKVRSLDRVVRNSIERDTYFILKGRTLKPTLYVGYPCVTLIAKGVKSQKLVKIHRLVAQSFLPNPEGKKCVNHIDGIKTNNLLPNLEWASYADNTRHAIDTGLIKFDMFHGTVNIVLDTATGIFYTLKEAAYIKGINYNYLRGMLNGTSRNKTSLQNV